MNEIKLHKGTTKLTESANIRKVMVVHWNKSKWWAVKLGSTLGIGITKIKSNMHTR